MRGLVISFTLTVAAVCAGCGGAANPVSPSPLTPAPARLDRVVEGGGGGGFLCMPGPCPPTGSLRVDAGDVDLSGTTTITHSATDPLSFVATATVFNLAGHVTGGGATVDVANRTMLLSLSLTGPHDQTLEISGEAEVLQTERVNDGCASRRDLVTEATFILRYLGRTVITEVHCSVP